MAKILVTGGAGFIGSNFCNAMAQKGHEVVAFDDLSLGKTENLSDKVRFVKGDVNKKEDLEKAGRDFDYIVHLAASSSAPMFARDMYWAYQNNVAGHIRVMQFAHEIGAKKMLFASTSSIYGNNPTPLTEDQEVTPPNHYSVTKFAQEGASRVYNKAEGLEIIAFRFMSVYGLNEGHKTTFANLVSQFIWDMARDVEPVLYGDGTQERDFTNAKDVVQGIELAMNTDKKYGFEIFNIGTNKCINLVDLVGLINRAMGKSIKPKFIENPVKEGYVKSQLADIGKISGELGYKPTVELEDGIREIVENLQKQK
ncbi:MAG: NAD-dependent epimerase/dehydratase family protein [Magnetococcus sp. WYHC-3]